MKNAGKHIGGVADKVRGNVKKNVGKLIHNQQMEAEGALTELKGEAKIEAARVSEQVTGAVEEVTGAVKKHAGEAIDNQQMQVEGAARELKGKARRAINK